ncbi:hypothetical protein G6F35_003293 [Rhizopus arrhizus]|nr:hypothetical protein G6F23_007897 [Rhizopus arrhizus]KAG1225664.1 hypothetical protein G6F35_003293 [Rhizopus arrhizus]KAG1273298.1 hypothetical protein G6F65_011133 [Rhizopus arrhizus]
MIIDKKYAVLNNVDVKRFWASMLDAELRDARYDQYNQIRFINQTQAHYANSPPTRIKKKSRSAITPPTEEEIRSFVEENSITVEGMEDSLASWVGRDGRATTIIDRKSRYFSTLGMNGVFDLSDTSIGSHIFKLPSAVQEKIRLLFSPFPAANASLPTERRFAEIHQEVHRTENDNKRYYKRYLEKLYMYKPFDKYGTNKRLYILMLELLVYDECIFDEKLCKLLSEGDYLVKVWGPLFETLFRGTGVILHWGDTVAENVRAMARSIKLDLRLMMNMDYEKGIPDLGSSELAKDIHRSKFYRDKLKTVLSSKIDLNQMIESFPNSYGGAPPIHIPFIIMNQLEATMYSLQLAHNGLYVLNEVTTISLPITLIEVKDGGIERMVERLNLVKKLVMDVKHVNEEVIELRNIKKRKTIKNLTITRNSSNTNEADQKVWMRPVWFPPKYESDSDDA